MSHPTQELLDDLCSRFIVNVPREDLQSFERMLFLVEQAHWFYEDTLRERNPALKSFSLREFTVLLFQRCAALQAYMSQVHQIYDDFNAYKVKVPVAGAVLLDCTLQCCLLVKGWKASSSWGFPKGKKSKNEEDHVCAAREVLEETGFDISALLKPDDFLESSAGERRCRLFVVSGIDMRAAAFHPQTKKEISEIAWHTISDLVTARGETSLPVATRSSASGARFYMVQPFARSIAAWIARHQTSATRLLAAQSPVRGGTIITCWASEAASDSATPIPDSFQPRGETSEVMQQPPTLPAPPVMPLLPVLPAPPAAPVPESQTASGGLGEHPPLPAGHALSAAPTTLERPVLGAEGEDAPIPVSAIVPPAPAPLRREGADVLAYGAGAPSAAVAEEGTPPTAIGEGLMGRRRVPGIPAAGGDGAPALGTAEVFPSLVNFRFDMGPVLEALAFGGRPRASRVQRGAECSGADAESVLRRTAPPAREVTGTSGGVGSASSGGRMAGSRGQQLGLGH